MRAAAVFALSAGVIVPAVIHAPAAHADATSLSGMTLDDGRYRLKLPANALWIKVSVLASTAPGAAVLASTEALTTDNVDWETDAPFALPQGTALGDYPVRVDYRLPGGTTQQSTGGTYSYRPHIGVTDVSWNRTSTSYDQRQAVLSGKTTLWNPATGARTAAPGGTKVAITLTSLDGTGGVVNSSATTRTDGSFSVTLTPNGWVSGSATVVTAGTVNDPNNAAYVPSLGVETLLYRISADVNKYRVRAGTDVRVTGHVERYTPTGWKRFAGAPVVATGEQSYGAATTNVLGSATSSATGTFSFNARAQYSTDFVYTSLRPSPYFGDSRPYAKSDIAVPQQFSYSPHTITLDEHGKLTATGGFGSAYCRNGQPVHLQVSFDAGSTWRVLRSGMTDSGCSYTFTTQGYESALYRIYHPETNELVAKGSTSLKRARTPTRFSAFGVSPTQPTVNGKMTVSGTVQRKVGGLWKPLPGTKVTLVYKPKGESQWYWVNQGITTDANGRFSYRATAYGDGSWALYLNTTGSYFYSETNAKYIDAR
ncbi:hypothetical protein OG357_17325 [Streptomyces sp. NBC_01255]|uniref:hypothetical protein n=1 Tax=Streptomyces sp. NBC_01255 TaxID=2903798 RepID=UPI002E3697B7|nr:hypothetical protein [Streptomyces sp. NBC_01255]